MIDNLNFLTSVDIFTSLDQTELQELQGRMLPRTVEVDHPVIRQGDVGNSLFILKKGRLDVFLVEDNKNVLVGTLGPGDFFGEMSLLTGHARSATVIPVETSIVLEISKQALSFFMHRHDGLAEQMGETLSNRQMSNLKAMMEFEHSIQVIANEDLAADLSHRIRRFFELPASIWGRAVDGLSDLGFLSGKQNDEEEENKQIAFTTALIVLVAKMATVANSFEGKELVRLRDIFDIPSSEMTNVRRIYDRAQGNPKGYETYVKQISDLFDDDTAVREELIGVLLKIGGGKTETATFIEDVVEATHNGIVAWEKNTGIQPILLKGKDDYIKTKELWNIIEEFFQSKNIDFQKITTVEGNIITKLIDLIYFFDYSSLYSAVLSEVDPSPVDSINFVKNKIISELKFVYSENNTLSIIFQNNDLIRKCVDVLPRSGRKKN